jgi:hypothetical protein
MTMRSKGAWLQQDVESRHESLDRRSVRMILTVDGRDAVFTQAIIAGATEVFDVYEEHGWRIGHVAGPLWSPLADQEAASFADPNPSRELSAYLTQRGEHFNRAPPPR